MIRGIAFDWGGIFTEGTFDSDAVRNLARLLEVDEERVAEVYYPLMAHFEAGSIDIDEFVARFRDQSGLAFDDGAFRSTFLSSGIERSAMYRVLASIPDSYRIAVLSNNVQHLCDRVRNDPRMARVELFLFSNEIQVRKPDPRAYELLSEGLTLPPQEILFIDDSARNVEACRELDFNGIHLRDLDQFLAALREYVPDFPLELVDEPA